MILQTEEKQPMRIQCSWLTPVVFYVNLTSDYVAVLISLLTHLNASSVNMHWNSPWTLCQLYNFPRWFGPAGCNNGIQVVFKIVQFYYPSLFGHACLCVLCCWLTCMWLLTPHSLDGRELWSQWKNVGKKDANRCIAHLSVSAPWSLRPWALWK